MAAEQNCQNISGGADMFWNKTCYPIGEYCELFNFTLVEDNNCVNNSNTSIIKSYDEIGSRIGASEDYYT